MSFDWFTKVVQHALNNQNEAWIFPRLGVDPFASRYGWFVKLSVAS